MSYFLTSFRSGIIPSASVPMTPDIYAGFQKDLLGEVLVFSAFPSKMGGLPGLMTLPSPGVDFPFRGWQDEVEQFSKGRINVVKEALLDKAPLGSPLTIIASPPDTTPLLPVQKLTDFDWEKYLPLKKNQHFLSGEKPGSTMFPEFVPASSYTTISCDLLSEIQRHMLEPTIDGGLTWSDLWTKAEIQKFLNNRLSRFFLETGVIQREFSVSVAAGLSEFNYPSDLIQAKRLTFEQNLSLYTDLVSFFRLQEATGATREDSIGPNDLTSVNGVSQVTGIINYGAGFSSASSQRLIRTNATQTGLNPRLGDWALSAWFYPTASGDALSRIIVSKFSNTTLNGYSIFTRGTTSPTLPSRVSVTFGAPTGGAGCQFHTTSQYNLNAWNHIVVSFDRDGFITVYLNGVWQAAFGGSSSNMSAFGNTTGDSNTDADFFLGAAWTFAGPPENFFDGRIDAVGIWNRQLTRAEMASLYNSGSGRELFPGAHDGPYVVLPRVDPFTQDNGSPGWEDLVGTPSSIIEEPRSPLSFQLSPTPNVAGSVEGIYVADPAAIGDACVPLPIPNYLTWIIKYGVMSDMLRKEGEANDPQRAEYCENRWKEGIQLTRLLLGWSDADAQENQ